MGHMLDKTTVKRILQLHQLQGLSPQVIGQRFGFSTSRIYNIIRRQASSLQARKRVGRPPLKNQGSSLTAPGTWDIMGL